MNDVGRARLFAQPRGAQELLDEFYLHKAQLLGVELPAGPVELVQTQALLEQARIAQNSQEVHANRDEQRGLLPNQVAGVWGAVEDLEAFVGSEHPE